MGSGREAGPALAQRAHPDQPLEDLIEVGAALHSTTLSGVYPNPKLEMARDGFLRGPPDRFPEPEFTVSDLARPSLRADRPKEE